jgi:hypothetical protein
MKKTEEPRGLINLDLIEKKADKLFKYLKKRYKKKHPKIKGRNRLIE